MKTVFVRCAAIESTAIVIKSVVGSESEFVKEVPIADLLPDEWISVEDRLPESERYVIAYGKNSYGNGRTIRAFYAEKFTVEQSDDDEWTDYDEKSDEFYLPKGWYECNEFDEVHYHVDFPITHWMPLPEPLKQQLNEKK